MSTNIPNNGLQSCEVLPNSSWYLGCNGTRVKSPLYQRKMKDLFALTNHFGDVGFNYVSLEVRKCLLYRFVSTGEVRNHHEKIDGSNACIFSVRKKRNIKFRWKRISQGVLIKESDFTPAFEGVLSICTWSSEQTKAQRFCKKGSTFLLSYIRIHCHAVKKNIYMSCSEEWFTQIIELSVERPCWETVFKITNSMR